MVEFNRGIEGSGEWPAGSVVVIFRVLHALEHPLSSIVPDAAPKKNEPSGEKLLENGIFLVGSSDTCEY